MDFKSSFEHVGDECGVAVYLAPDCEDGDFSVPDTEDIEQLRTRRFKRYLSIEKGQGLVMTIRSKQRTST